MSTSPRGAFGVSLRRCLSATAWPTAACAIVAVLGNAFTKPTLDSDVPAAASPWLMLPLLVPAIGCCLAAVHLWPTFCQRRPGADTIRRLTKGATGGRLAVIGGALCAQLLLTLPIAPLLANLLEAPAQARRLLVAEPPPEPILVRDGARLTFVLPAPMTAEQIWLRPAAAMPQDGMDATVVALTADEQPLVQTPIAFESTYDLVRAEFAPRTLSRFELTRTSGHVPLLFARGSVSVIGPAELPTWQNALLLAVVAAGTSLLTLVLAALLGLAAGWPTVGTAIAATHFLQWIGGVGPIDDAILMVLRGQWLVTG